MKTKTQAQKIRYDVIRKWSALAKGKETPKYLKRYRNGCSFCANFYDMSIVDECGVPSCMYCPLKSCMNGSVYWQYVEAQSPAELQVAAKAILEWVSAITVKQIEDALKEQGKP